MFPFREGHASVPCRADSLVRLCDEFPREVFPVDEILCDGFRSVGGTIIHDDEFKIPMSLVCKIFKSSFKDWFRVEAWHHDAYRNGHPLSQ
jgi:hypothetical protein